MIGLTSRAVLSGIAALPALKAVPVTAQPGQDVEVMWCEWVEGHRIMNGPSDPPDDFNQLYDRMSFLEQAIADAAPSPMRAAATAMIEICFGIFQVDYPPSSERRSEGGRAWLAMHILPCLLPHLFGHVAECAADIAANPDRALRESLLFAPTNRST